MKKISWTILTFMLMSVSAKELDFSEIAGNMLLETLNSEDGLSKIAQGLQGMGGGGALNALLGALSGGGGKGMEQFDFMSTLMPLLLNQGHKHSDNPDLEDSSGHSAFDRATEKLANIASVIWEMIKKTEYVKKIMSHAAVKALVDLVGSTHFNASLVEHYLNMFEDPVARKEILKIVANYLAKIVHVMPNEEGEKVYSFQFGMVVNNILKQNGYRDHEMFEIGRPFADSLSKVVNSVARKELSLNINSATYIKPVFSSLKDLVVASRQNGWMLEKKIVTLLNAELFEGLLRTWRAHKYALANPKCDQYLLCELNKKEHSEDHVVRPVITKLSSAISAWFLSGRTGTSFLDLYTAAFLQEECERTYPVDCSPFHAADRIAKLTFHNEL